MSQPPVPTPTLNRFYLHGDVLEGNPERLYCARCDNFVATGHFEGLGFHGDDNDGDRFLNALARYEALSPDRKALRPRPADARNVLAERRGHSQPATPSTATAFN